MNFKIKDLFGRLIGNPNRLFWFFIIVNMIPSLVLAYTEPYSIVGKAVLVTLPLGFYCMVYSVIKNIGLLQLLLIPQLIFHAFQLVLIYLFGESAIAVDMFLNLATTNVTEAGELLDNLCPAIIIVCVIYIPTIVTAAIAYKRRMLLTLEFRKKAVFKGLLTTILSFALMTTATNKDTGERFRIQNDIYPVNVYHNLHYAITKWQRSSIYPLTSKDFRFHAQKTDHICKREIYILVIGEAARANNWSLWGYGRETNPLLSKTPGLVIYKDAITQANATHKSVPLILSAIAAENYDSIYHQKSIIEAFKETGFTTVFLSNQTPNRTFTDYFSEEADYRQNIRKGSLNGIYTENNYDTYLLPLCRHYINSLPGNLFIVLHTYGSHFNYKERYPAEFARFTPDNATKVEIKNREQLINAYDNSILYTDYLLHNLVNLLDSTGDCTALYYTPDHGEDLLDDDRKRFLHASPHPTYYQLHIPIFLWFSAEYQEYFPERYKAAIHNSPKPISTNSVFHTLLDIASIGTPYLNRERSLINPGFKAEDRLYLNDLDKSVFFYNSGLKKQDKEMIEKHGLAH